MKNVKKRDAAMIQISTFSSECHSEFCWNETPPMSAHLTRWKGLEPGARRNSGGLHSLRAPARTPVDPILSV